MMNLDLKEVSEMVFRYMQENQIDLLTAYKSVNNVLLDKNTFTFEEIKNYLFKNSPEEKTVGLDIFIKILYFKS